MGNVCCCPMPEDVEELVGYPNGSLLQRCACVRWLVYWYTTLFDRVAGQGVPSNQGSPSTSGILPSRADTSMETYRAPPRPSSFEPDARYVRLPRDGLVSRKSAMGHLYSANSESAASETVALLPRQSSDLTDQAQDSDSVDKQQSSKLMTKSESMLSLIDDEDVCPTCLDVYTNENPKIDTECKHHFHLACIYEWLERSSKCPVCDKDMKFNENTGV